MYDVVGCSSCQTLWIRSGDSATAQCPRCQKTHKVARLRTLASAETPAGARDARSHLLAERSEQADGAVAGFSSLTDAVEDAGVSDATYLSAHGIDPESVDAVDSDESIQRNRRQTVLYVIESLENPTEKAIIATCKAHGVAAGDAREMLVGLVEAGAVSSQDGSYRVL